MKYNPREYVALGVIRSRLSAAGAQTGGIPLIASKIARQLTGSA